MHYYEDIVHGEIVEWYYKSSPKSMVKVYDDRVVDMLEEEAARHGLQYEADDADDIADAEERMM
ncbi:hypothetical protein A2U01_0113416, partial [Trifolium medium]|nr:hypothetical protein [Trifolium medium]